MTASACGSSRAPASGRRRRRSRPSGAPFPPAGRSASPRREALAQVVGRRADRPGCRSARRDARSARRCPRPLRPRGREIIAPRTLRVAPGSRRAPLEVIIRVRLLTRSGARAAMRWAIIPPIDAPQTWAEAMPSTSSTATLSAAMSLERVGAPDAQAEREAQRIERRLGTPPSSKLWLRPMSRLSKRMTRKPRATSSWRRSPRASRAAACPGP